MDQSEGSDLSLTDKKEGRRPKRHAKGKTSSFPDEAPTFIEERISGPPAVQVVRYVRHLVVLLPVYRANSDELLNFSFEPRRLEYKALGKVFDQFS